ncbi:MAG: aspartate-semialdehyde dehydrogenase [Candidatus Kuenenbacteria bacterium]
MRFVIIGATGIVGQEVIKCLEKRKVLIASLRLVASAKSEGKIIKTIFGKIKVEKISEEVFKNSDIAFFVAGSEISLAWAKKAAKLGAIVIDNSSCFRYDSDVPLVIPEINQQEIFNHKGIIANPNCTTAIASIPLWVIKKNFGLKKILVSTYQAVSGAGKDAIKELEEQVRDYSQGNKLKIKKFQHQILFNIIPHIDTFQKNNYTREEMKVVWEIQKIFNDKKVLISCTAVRIPVMRAHSESIVVETQKKISQEKVRLLFEKTSGIKVVDQPEQQLYPMPLFASDDFSVHVGRIRQSLVFGNYGLEFFVSGDQLLKGAALNAVQIAEELIKNKF